MAWTVEMSERELKRVSVVAQVEDGSLSARQAAGVLGLSVRQVQRLKKRMAEEGPSGLAHKLRGRPSNRKIAPRVWEWALGVIREKYADYGPTLAAETLEEVHGFKVGRETLRQWMIEDELWLSRKERKRFQQPRLRREHVGELVQIDGSEHRWFEERGDPCSLPVFIDDATSRLQKLRFCEAESTFSYFQALGGYLTEHGRPLTFYSDKHSVFKLNRPSKCSGETMTQFGRALAELQIEIICADTSQAKGRVERANRTLQDRLVKALRAKGISTIDEANAFLPGFVERFNVKFARRPANDKDLHRPLRQSDQELREILCLKDQRYVGNQLTVTYDRKKIILDPEGTAKDLVGKYVDIHQYADGSFSVIYGGEALSYRVFDDAQQQVTHASIVENKRLSAVLRHVKEQQDQMPKPTIKRANRKNGYTKTGKKPGQVPGTPGKKRAEVSGSRVEKVAEPVL